LIKSYFSDGLVQPPTKHFPQKKPKNLAHFLKKIQKETLEININIFPQKRRLTISGEGLSSSKGKPWSQWLRFGPSFDFQCPNWLRKKRETLEVFTFYLYHKRAKKLTTENRKHIIAQNAIGIHWPIFENIFHLQILSCNDLLNFWSSFLRRFSCGGVEAVVQGGVSE